MPRLALALCVLWFLSLFVFRSLLQWRRTGSTGVKGFHGRPGSLPWLAGVAVILGLALAALAPLAAIYGGFGGRLLFTDAPTHWAGAALVFFGMFGALAAQLGMGESWRIGVDESERTELVTQGFFHFVRNPIFSFIWISALGMVLLVPNPHALLATALTIAGIEVQVRAVEEPYLESAHGSTYTRYAARVGRFFPGVGRLARG